MIPGRMILVSRPDAFESVAPHEAAVSRADLNPGPSAIPLGSAAVDCCMTRPRPERHHRTGAAGGSLDYEKPAHSGRALSVCGVVAGKTAVAAVRGMNHGRHNVYSRSNPGSGTPLR